MLDYEGNPMKKEEVERQAERILSAPQVVRDTEYPFPEDLIVYSSGAVDFSFRVLAKVTALVEALRLSGSYELVHQLWSQFTLVAGRVSVVIVNVTWSGDEVLVTDSLVPCNT